MRIIAGHAKGMPLATPRSGVRPTSDRTRQAIFSSLGAHVVGASVLDLFAGTGALGLEAASRGAASVTFVDNARDALECLERNAGEFTKRVREADEASTIFQVRRASVSDELDRMASAQERFLLIFADPPYGDAAQGLLANENLPRLLHVGGLMVLESAKREALHTVDPWELIRESFYGDTRVSLLRARRSLNGPWRPRTSPPVPP